jgi:hypothetical protein
MSKSFLSSVTGGFFIILAVLFYQQCQILDLRQDVAVVSSTVNKIKITLDDLVKLSPRELQTIKVKI